MSRRTVYRSAAPASSGTGNPLFDQNTGAGFKLLGWLLASAILIAVDARTELLAPLRSALGSAVAPIQFAAYSPYRAWAWLRESTAERHSLVRRIAALERELLTAQGTVTRYQALRVENARLRQLLDSTERVEDDVLVAELVATSTSPQQVVVDKGQLHQVAVGNAVIDSVGLFGQVVQTTAFTSEVLLITDPTHAVPVRVLRNDVRAIAVGTGRGQLRLKDVAVTLDIVEGDELVSSGLGGQFPTGYPVGTVERVTRDPTEPFADIVATPSAQLERSEQLLVVFAGAADASAAAAQALEPPPP